MQELYESQKSQTNESSLHGIHTTHSKKSQTVVYFIHVSIFLSSVLSFSDRWNFIVFCHDMPLSIETLLGQRPAESSDEGIIRSMPKRKVLILCWIICYFFRYHTPIYIYIYDAP